MPFKSAEEQAAYDKERYLKNRDKKIAADKKRREEDPSYREHKRQYAKAYYSADKTARLEQNKRWRERNPEKAKESRLRERLKPYGLTPESYRQLLETQRHSCALCEEPFVKTPHVDHCHDTGRVRGLLCGDCNTSLGKLGDTVESFRKVLRYLESETKL